MDWRSMKFDWNRARAFLVTAEEGSLSAAARALGLTQPTLGRQVAALEEELGVLLFDRAGRGLTLTDNGLELVDHVRAMGEAASHVSMTASGQSRSVEGTVRITATEVASAFMLPAMIDRLRAAHPGIEVELVATNLLRDLRRREADIAIRTVRPTDPQLIARKLPSEVARLYASRTYLDTHGPFDAPEDLSEAQFIGFEDNVPFIEFLNGMGLGLAERQFAVRTAVHLVHWEMVRQGLGIGVMLSRVGDADPTVARVVSWLDPFEFEVWLVAHREVNSSRRVRLVFDWLVKEFCALPPAV
ncbi:LysR family transcriptional regulator [Roseobacter sinensis]|uniref:LysR family transcriptional regulator n=1 Tax=Roseobacter sinensis TaxID=2931391 RepID=A0ABT3BE28_9RHOB|nr:LysR family transcriptional regulator [Roseobacter sp. WL0113]MCV3271819.1 LysR family transcriptional regulator [Roseobacter sp. WL0113]